MLKFWLVVASCILCSALPASAQTSTITFGLSGSVVNSNKSYSSVDADVTALLQWGSVAYAALVLAQPPTVQFTGSISGTTLTATAVASGNLAKNQFLYGPNILGGTYITALGTGGGGPGTYTVSDTQTVASEAMTSYGPDVTATGLYQGTMNAWIQAEQKFTKDKSVTAVPNPPPMGWH